MTPNNFLKLGGIILVVVAILGMVGIIGPTAGDSIFGSSWWFDSTENWVHLVLGIVALVAWKAFPAASKRPLVMLVGIIALVAGLYSLFVGDMIGAAHLEQHSDTVLHLVIGVWALAASRRRGMM